MSYQLVLKELVKERDREIGEDIFFENLNFDCEVYLLYYSGAMVNEDLENKLRDFGEITEKNLFVNIGRLKDPNYKEIRNKFGITNLPVIIMTAVDTLASPPAEYSTAYVRIDNENLLSSPDSTIKCAERLFNLFLGGRISEALKQYKKDQRDVFISRLKGIVTDGLRGTWEFLKERDINVSLIEGKFELKKSGG